MVYKYDYRTAAEAQDYSQMTLAQLASEIYRAWKNVNYAAAPYLDAMSSMGEKDPNKARYMFDPGSEIVARFLGNASSFRGPEAKAIKAELQKRLKRR